MVEQHETCLFLLNCAPAKFSESNREIYLGFGLALANGLECWLTIFRLGSDTKVLTSHRDDVAHIPRSRIKISHTASILSQVLACAPLAPSAA